MKVVNLTENHSGCLHDYQLTTNDMRMLEGADIFVMNGGGMESFLGDVTDRYPELVMIDASEGISLLQSAEEHHHEETQEEEEHVHAHVEGKNAHVWMD